MDKARILLVDDDSSIRWVLARALQNAGFKVVSVESVAQAEWQLADFDAELVITDIRMPGRDGFSLLETLHRQHPEIPVIVMTAHSDLDTGVRSHAGGAFDFIAKPFDINVVIDLVQRALAKSRDDTRQAPAWQLELEERARTGFHQEEPRILEDLQEEFESAIMDLALELAQGHKQKAAQLLGWGRNTLTRKLRQRADTGNTNHEDKP